MSQKNNLLLCSLFFVTVASVYGQAAYSLKSHKMTVEGTSSMHEWTSDVTQLTSSGRILVENKAIKEIKDVTVSIKVVSIKSTKGKTMDNKTYEAFDSDKNPAITYKLSSVSITGGALQAKGSLAMAGTTKEIVMNANAKLLANGDVQLTGSHQINMKDFNMVPPTAVLGTIKVGELVTVKFDLVLAPSK